MKQQQKLFISLVFMLLAQSASASSFPIVTKNSYTPILDLYATKYSKRLIGEADLMLPMWQSYNNLGLFDIKFKKDHKSFEYNLGIVYRHNFDDRWIFGIYSYFDRRRTEHKLEANQWTFGMEALSNFFDARFNFYLPENKKRTIYTKPRELRRDHTAIYAVSEGKFQEHTLPGYDIEVGTPLFSFLPKMNDQLGTRVYVAKYNFTRKGIAKNSGLRFRLEQKLFEDRLKDSPFSLTLHLGTHYTNKKKWDNFVGLSLRIPLSQDRPNRTKMQERMMDTVVRDVDIRTEKRISQPKEPLHLEGKPIDNVYFVAENTPGGCGGDGSSISPYCTSEYIEKLRSKKPGFMIVPIGHFTEEAYNTIMRHPDAVDNLTHDAVLATHDLGATFSVKDHFPELKLVKSKDEQVHTYSAVTAIYSTEQIESEQDLQGSESLYYNRFEECISPAYIYKKEPQVLHEAEKNIFQEEQKIDKTTVESKLMQTTQENEILLHQDILCLDEENEEVLVTEGGVRLLEQINPDKLSDYTRYLHNNLVSKKTNAKVMNNLIQDLKFYSLQENNIQQHQQYRSSPQHLKPRPSRVFALNTPTNAQITREFLSKQPKPPSPLGAENNAAAMIKSQTKPLIRTFDVPPLRPMRAQ